MQSALWPLCVLLSFAGYAWAFALGWDSLRAMLVPGILVALIIGLEHWRPRRRQAIPRIGRGFWHDIGHTLVGSVGTPLGELLFFGVAAAIAGRISAAFGANLWPLHWPFALQVLAAVFVADGLEYARHRAMHTVPWLWPIHSIHHSMQEIHVLKSGRLHPLGMLLRALCVMAPLVALGAPAEVLWWYPAAITILGPISHANLETRLPGWAHYGLLTPALHRIHHARALELAQSNYAAVFPLWDVLFGSFEHPDRHADQPDPRVGIENDPLPRSFAGQLLWPFSWRSSQRA